MSFFEQLKGDVVFLRGILRALKMTMPIAKNPRRVFPLVVTELAEKYGEAPALISDRESFSYRTLAERSNRYARWTRAQGIAKGDTIYAAVETTGTGTASLKAKWTFHKGDKAADVNESTETLNASGPAVTAFHVAKPSGWPPGDYQVEIFLGDKSAGVKKFTVK